MLLKDWIIEVLLEIFLGIITFCFGIIVTILMLVVFIPGVLLEKSKDFFVRLTNVKEHRDGFIDV